MTFAPVGPLIFWFYIPHPTGLVVKPLPLPGTTNDNAICAMRNFVFLRHHAPTHPVRSWTYRWFVTTMGCTP